MRLSGRQLRLTCDIGSVWFGEKLYVVLYTGLAMKNPVELEERFPAQQLGFRK